MRRRWKVLAAIASVALVMAAAGWWMYRWPVTDRIVLAAGSPPTTSEVCGHYARPPEVSRPTKIGTGVQWVVLCADPAGVRAPRPGVLVRDVQAVVGRFNALPRVPLRMACNLVGGTTYDLVFGYGDGSAQVVVGDTGGCGIVGGLRGARQMLDTVIDALAREG